MVEGTLTPLYKIILTCVVILSSTSRAAEIDGANLRGALIGEKLVIGCLGTKPFEWRNDDGIKLNNGNGLLVDIESFSKFSTLTIVEFNDGFSRNYTCTDIDGPDTATVFKQGYSLTINGTLPHTEGDPVNLTCNFTSPGRVVSSYKWIAINSDGSTSRYLTNSSDLYIDSVPRNDSGGVYQCKVEVDEVPQPFTVNVSFIFKPVLIGPSVVNKSVVVNESSQAMFELPCTIIGHHVQYSWTRGDTPVVNGSNYQIDPHTGSLYVLGSILYSDALTYTCTGSNEAGTLSVVYDILVEGSPNITNHGGIINELYTGMSLLLPCIYQSYPTPDITLQFSQLNSSDTTVIDQSRYTIGETGLTIQSLTVNDNGLFYCVVNNSYGMDNITYTVTVYGVPDAPVLSASTSPESVNVTLSIPNSESTVVDFYTVKINISNEGEKEFVILFEPEVTLLVIDGLTPDTHYQISATAQNRAGIGEISETKLVITKKSAPKFHFFNITRLDGGRSLRFDWLLLHNGGSPVTTFNITVSPTSMATPITATPTLSAGNHTIQNLEPNIEYSVQISLGNNVDTSLDSYVVTTARGPPLTPTQPSVSDVQLTSAQLSFTVPSIGSDHVDYYLINIQSNDGVKQIRINSNHSRVITVSSQPATPLGVGVAQSVVLLIGSLDSDTSYTFNVSVGGAVGRSPFSESSAPIRTGNAMVLYYIVGGVVLGSLSLILFIVIVVAVMVIVTRRKKKRIGQKHTITDRIHEPTNFGFPNSSMSEAVHTVEEYSPPSSSMEDHKEEIVSPPPYPGYFKVNHHRTLSISSTTSSQMCRKPDYLRSPTDHLPPQFLHVVDNNCNDSAYGGSADKGVNHIYHQIPHKGMPAADNKLTSYSFPSINRVTSYDVDQLPPRLNCATDV